MNRMWMVAALAACTLVPASSDAQEPRARPRTRPRVQVEQGPWGAFTFNDNRGRIGVLVDTKADETRDRVGARIEGVTPGGPAETAGLKASDIITRFNGTALGGANSENEDESGPGMKLIELARALEPGDTVQVDYRRGTENRKATIVAEDLGGYRGFVGPDMREFERAQERAQGMLDRMRIGPGDGNMEFIFRGPWAGIELVKLNPDLGDYFGTREGVLVVSAPEDSTLALKGGDVILSIGGRKPTSPAQAMRILRSYDEGETVTVEVQRKQRRQTISWKVPDTESNFYKMGPREEPTRLLPKTHAPFWKIRDVVRTMRVI